MCIRPPQDRDFLGQVQHEGTPQSRKLKKSKKDKDGDKDKDKHLTCKLRRSLQISKKGTIRPEECLHIPKRDP